MRRAGALPERCASGRVIDKKKAEKLIGARVRIHDTVWASGLHLKGKLWEDCESQVGSGTAGTIGFGTSGYYTIHWDTTDDLRLGYTMADHWQLKDLIERGVLEVIG